jgi:DNA-binding response OmpR family regulator
MACDILLAEDNPADVYLIKEALKEHGIKCCVRVAPDGRAALNVISGESLDGPADRFSLVILDLNLPLHDGIEILRRLREKKDLVHVPVVVLTSSDSPRDRLLATQLGATRYLRKPFSLEQFLSLGAVFKELLEQSGKAAGA